MTFISYAQNFEDVLLWRAFGHLDRGFYIDVGAAHPDVDSVTRAFYDRGWSGINIEPVCDHVVRLRGARPRDVTLQLAVGAARETGIIYVVAGTGLSTIDPALADQHRAHALDVHEQDVDVDTLANICREHAPATIHFLKIDAEGAESAVLQGADFTHYRPQIVLVEATAPGTTVSTHEAWEPALLAVDYRFVWFDGLNRFYAAAEHFEQLAPHFRVPVCVFDDFLRAADTEWTRRISQAELQAAHARQQAAELLEQAMLAEAAVGIAETRAGNAQRRMRELDTRARELETRAIATEQRALAMEARAASAEHLVRHNEAQRAAESERLRAALQRSQDEEAALRASTSWRLTAPLRGAVQTTRTLTRRGRGSAPAPVELAVTPAASARPVALVEEPARLSRPLQTVHQFHSGSAVGDAITNSLLLIRKRLRAMGYHSDIFVEHRDPLLEDELRMADELPIHDGYVLVFHHSMGFDAFERIVALPAPKILMYHNITPPEFFAGQPYIQHQAVRGRQQLARLRDHVVSALADSEYNAIELRRLGFDDVGACTLLFDLAEPRRLAPQGRGKDDRPFTILFVGRIVPSKGQLELVDAFAAFRKLHHRPSRLVLVGRGDGVGQSYLDDLQARIVELHLGSHVTLTGLASDEALREHFLQADLYVSLSRHEGFGVPLVEAAASGVPVLAWPAGAVPYTLSATAGLLASRETDVVAARIAELANDPGAREALARVQAASLGRFSVQPQLARLSYALARAGAAALPPATASGDDAAALLAHNARFTVAGHVNKTYSLAAINRTLARMLERIHPGRVRLEAVEGEPTGNLAEVPVNELAFTSALAARPPHETGPVIVISQHYPVHVPRNRGDVLLALVFWEESLVPAETVATLNTSFDAVLAPSRFVAKALTDSGVCVPVHMVGYAPELDDFLALPGPLPDLAAPFTFLHVSSAFPRKGMDVLLAAFTRAFRAADPVRLVVKTFPNPHNDTAAQIDALRQNDTDAPVIELIDGDLSQDDLLELYRDADTVVLPTRGEGFNLPAAEAVAAGVPLIVTGAGGHMDFCDADTVRLVRYHLAESRSHVATAMSLWAEPDVDDLVAALHEAVADRPASLARATKARGMIAARLDAGQLAHAIGRTAIDALLRSPDPSLRVCVVTSWNVRCGVAGYSRFLVNAMREADPKMLVAVLSDKRPHDGEPAGIPVQDVWTLGSEDVSELLLALDQQDPHVVMVQHQPGLLDWATLGRLLRRTSSSRRALVVTLHNTAHLLDVEQDARETATEGLRMASRVIVHSLADVERLAALGLANVVLVPHGAPSPLPAPPARVLKRAKPVAIGCCGFLLPGKGIPTLVEAVAILRRTWPGAVLKLHNASYGHPISDEETERVRDTIRNAGLADSVELLTDYLPFDEARRRLADCDVIVLPYPESKEAASGALHMALSAGPCVAVTPIGLFDGAAGAVYRLPATDAKSIAQGLSALLDDQTLRSSIADAARDWLDARSWLSVGMRVAGMMRGLSVSRQVASQ